MCVGCVALLPDAILPTQPYNTHAHTLLITIPSLQARYSSTPPLCPSPIERRKQPGRC